MTESIWGMPMINEKRGPVSIPDSHKECIMCGSNNESSFNLKFNLDETGCVSTVFQGNRNLQGYEGLMHGGIISSLLDCAMTYCLFSRNVEARTAELIVRFIKPVPCDSSLFIKAWVISASHSLYRLKAELSSNNGLLARAESKFIEIKSNIKEQYQKKNAQNAGQG
jgi:acyl-coenzyme A thioesterase PaaI-like protein